MFGIDDVLLASVAAPVIGGVLGNVMSQGDAGRSGDAYRQALAQYAGISVPELEKLNLDQLSSVGALNPQMEQALGLGPSAMEGIALNPEMRAKQMEALQMFSDRAHQGLTPEDQAAFELARRSAAGEAQAKEGQILQNMQSRGMGGSGAELIARLQNGQSSADRQQQAGLQQAMASQQAKMAAAQQYGNMASGLRGQDFNEQSNVAQAKDLINRINQQNAQSVQQRNVGSSNQAQQFNLQNNQSIANQNVGLRNQQQMYNKGLAQQNFQNQMQRAGGLAGQYNNMGNYYGQQAQNTASMWSGLGKGIGGAFMGYNQMQNANKGADAMANYWNNAGKMAPSYGMNDPDYTQHLLNTDYGQIQS